MKKVARMFGALITAGVFGMSVTVFLPSNAVADGTSLSACSALDGEGCCACNSEGDCITVQHSGVASCTFEFCSSTPCVYRE